VLVILTTHFLALSPGVCCSVLWDCSDVIVKGQWSVWP